MKERGELRAFKPRHSSLFANTGMHPPAPRDSIKVDTYLCVPDTVMAARTYRDWLAKRGEPFDVWGWDAVGEPIGGPFYLRGHLQTVVGDALTELPTKLEVETEEEEEKKLIIWQISRGQRVVYQVWKNLLISCLAFPIEPNLDDGIQESASSRQIRRTLVPAWQCLQGCCSARKHTEHINVWLWYQCQF